MPQDRTLTELGGKQVSDLIGDDVKIRYTAAADGTTEGAVTGTIKYVKNWTEFDTKNSEKQSGNFFPVVLGDEYKGKDITVVGTETKTARDHEWILRLTNGTNSTFTFKDGQTVIFKLTFTGATLKQDEV